MSALTIARARVAELEAKQAALAAQIKEATAAREPVVAKLRANQARRAKRPIICSLAGQIYLHTMANLSPQVAYYRGDPKPKALTDALSSGGIKISVAQGFGASYTARGLTGRVRVPDAATLRAWRKATSLRQRAEAALHRAQVSEKAAAQAAFEAGTKIGFDALLPDLLTAARLDLAVAAVPAPANAEWELRRMTDGQFGELTIAKRHLAHAGKGEFDSGCPTCQQNRREAEEARVEAERIAALPTVMFECRSCNRRHRGATDEKRLNPTDAQVAELEKLGAKVTPYQWTVVPRVHCAKSGTWYIWATKLAEWQAKEAKAAARTKAKAVRFTCPNTECAEDVEAVPDGDEVVCPMCEVGLMVSSLRLAKPAKAAAA